MNRGVGWRGEPSNVLGNLHTPPRPFLLFGGWRSEVGDRRADIGRADECGLEGGGGVRRYVCGAFGDRALPEK